MKPSHGLLIVISCIVILLPACKGKINVDNIHEEICAVLAHPDDETIISGTLALLVSKGCHITVVYTTSGDDGPDETGQGLHGEPLAAVREKEALTALKAIGIQKPPIFLRYPDSHVPDHTEEIQHALYELFNEIKPAVVIGFGPDGITDDWDHKMTGFATDFAFDLTDSGRLLLHMAITDNSAPVYAYGLPVSKQAVNLSVKVSRFASERVGAFDAHHTQFSRGSRMMYKTRVHAMRNEKFIIARNRNADGLLHECFDMGFKEDDQQD